MRRSRPSGQPLRRPGFPGRVGAPEAAGATASAQVSAAHQIEPFEQVAATLPAEHEPAPEEAGPPLEQSIEAAAPGGIPVAAVAVPSPTEGVAAPDLAWATETVETIAHALEERVVGQLLLEETLLLGLMTGGHILLESVPGLAKTTAAATLARAVSGSFARIQCTPDLLPSDIVGTQVYDASTATFETRLGPVHANLVLLDEINRSSAKTQSAMLEAMQERQTSIAGRVYPLPEPFLVLATQNPIEQEGTYVLPEAQLDRFMLKDVLDYPTLDDEAEVVRRIDAGVYLSEQRPVVTLEDIRRLQAIVRAVYLDEAVVRYAVGLAFVTRHADAYLEPKLARYVQFGASPRASIAFAQAARARAIIAGRDHVITDDVKALAHRVLRHRIILGFEAVADEVPVENIIDAVVAAVRTP